jgi:hypothetical protein
LKKLFFDKKLIKWSKNKILIIIILKYIFGKYIK